MTQKDSIALAIEALQNTIDCLMRENEKNDGPICDTIWYDDHMTLFDFINCELAALRAQPAGWLPIESAPKDGTEFLLYAPATVFEGETVKERITFGAWAKPRDTPRLIYRDGFAPEPEWDDWEPYWASYDGGFTESHPPTHWMPMPQPPEAV